MRRTKATLPTLLLALGVPFLLAIPVYVFITAATAQHPGPPWRDITPKSMWESYRDGSDRQGRARRERERKDNERPRPLPPR
jgi:hypothetical protein